MNRSELYINYAAVIRFCRNTIYESTPWKGVRYQGEATGQNHPTFTAAIDEYEFAVLVLNDTLIFPGDKIYKKESGKEFTVVHAMDPESDLELIKLETDGKLVVWRRRNLVIEFTTITFLRKYFKTHPIKNLNLPRPVCVYPILEPEAILNLDDHPITFESVEAKQYAMKALIEMFKYLQNPSEEGN